MFEFPVAPVLARNGSSLRSIWRVLVYLTCLVAGRAASGGAPGQQDVSDLLVVFPTFHKRIGVVEASRAWRMGVSTHIVVDDLVRLDALRAAGSRHNETFSALPDLPGMPTSMRHVLAPLLAHTATGGRYKWMLLGDDDTLFSLPAVRGLLREMRLPHTEPIAISDFLVHCRFEQSAKLDVAGGGRRYTAPATRDTRCPAAAPSTQTAAASSSNSTPLITTPTTPVPCMLPPASRRPPRFRPHPDCPPEGRTSFYGGTGVILSLGLMQHLARRSLHAQAALGPDSLSSAAAAAAAEAAAADADTSFYAVAMSNYSPAGDVLMSEAWRRAGIGFTPPPPLPYQLACRRFGSLVGFNDEASPEAMVQRHRLAAEAAPEAFRGVVSAHLRQRRANTTAFLAAMRELGALLAAGGAAAAAGGAGGPR
eukprot:XP_001702431.1 predicted protein [Chlamydomonas reinhardtii]